MIIRKWKPGDVLPLTPDGRAEGYGYVYALLDADGFARYVGQSTAPLARAEDSSMKPGGEERSLEDTRGSLSST